MIDEIRIHSDLLKKEIIAYITLERERLEKNSAAVSEECLDYRAKSIHFENKYNQIKNSGFWKVTRPARVLFDWLKGTYVYRSQKDPPFPEAEYGMKCSIPQTAAEFVKIIAKQYDYFAVDFIGGLFTWIFYDENDYLKYTQWIDREIETEDIANLIIPRLDVLDICRQIDELRIKILILFEDGFQEKQFRLFCEQQYFSFCYEIVTREELINKAESSKIFHWYTRYKSENTEGIKIYSPKEQFEHSIQYVEFKNYIGTTIENSIILGYAVNVCWYNSPFSIQENGLCKIKDLKLMASAFFAPFFLKFFDYLQKTSDSNTTLLFLAREGYFLKKAYRYYCQSFEKTERLNYYFLTSRRAASVPAIQTVRDINDLLNIEYTGRVLRLLEERFGIFVSGVADYQVKLPQDKLKILEILKEYTDELLVNSMDEKDAYLSYIDTLIGTISEGKKLTLVDVGYSGSIQYSLMKMLDMPLDGCYLIEGFEVKPVRIDGTVRGLYSFWTSPRLEKTRLFLEAVTAAPYGQLERFQWNSARVEPVYKEEESFYQDMLPLQNSIYDYIQYLGKIANHKKFRLDKDLVEKIYCEILRPEILDASLTAHFIVNDGYCMDGLWIYDAIKEDWKICRDGEETYLNDL